METKGTIAKAIQEALNKYNPEGLPNDFYKFRPYSIFEFANLNVEDLFMTYKCEEYGGCVIEFTIMFTGELNDGLTDYFKIMTFNDLFESAYFAREIKVYINKPGYCEDIVMQINKQ